MNTTAYAREGDCEGLKSFMDWEISSQASGRPDEGSTTRLYNLPNMGYYRYPDYEVDDESPRVRDDQSLFEMFSRETGIRVLSKPANVQGMQDCVSETVAGGKRGKTQGATSARVSKLQRRFESLRNRVSDAESRKDEGRAIEVVCGESGGYQPQEAGEIRERCEVSEDLSNEKQCQTQAFASEYAPLDNLGRAYSVFRRGAASNTRDGNSASCGPCYSDARTDSIRAFSPRKSAGNSRSGKLSKEQQTGRRDSLIPGESQGEGIKRPSAPDGVVTTCWDISKIPLPFQDMISSDTTGNEYCSWMTDELAQPNIDNSVLDGDDIYQNDTKLGIRVGNHCQTSVKHIKVSKRARNSRTIGYSDALSEQVIRRQQELRRDVDAICVTSQASVPDDGTAKGIAGGLGSWIETAVDNGTPGGYNLSTGLTVAPTAVTKAALTESAIRDLCETIYTNGGNPGYLMSTPKMIRSLSEYLFTSSARVATLMSDQGKSREAAAALGSVNVFITDFGITLDLVPNRLQQADALAGGGDNVYILDPEYVRLTYLYGYNVESMAKTGLYDKRLMSVDWTLKVLNEKSQGVFFGADNALPVTA